MSLREAWASSPMPAVIVPAAVTAALAAELRGALERATYTRYALLDRGSYDVIDAGVIPELREVLDAIGGIAGEVTGRTLVRADARGVRLRPGDYLLTRHDRVHEDRPVELVLDLSAAPVPDVAVHWRHRGQVYFAMPSAPGSLAIVERGPTVMSNHTYLSKRREASIVRLIVLLRPAQ